jgi:Na+/H+ antiporter NhaD/arsenite permease-like protein
MDAHALAVNPWMMLPFGLLLGMIALGPLLFPGWWVKHYSKVACGLAVVTLTYYFAGLRAPERIWETTHEYLSFMAIGASLYVVAGGIHIQVKGGGTPLGNVLFLLIGAVLANFIGTTGASMLLIRPWLRMNRRRIAAHHVIFFIFIVSNVGGCLTPIGDPPLFLGYLSGVPFWWVAEHCLTMWMVAVGMLLAMFLVVDWRHFLRAPKTVDTAEPVGQWRFEGLGNLPFLALILAAVFINRPVFLREGLMMAATLGSWFITKKRVHEANDFNFHPIQEVALLFIGIFATMMPALDWLQANAGGLKEMGATFCYWGCGTLSSVLDNAPTYLCFLKTLFGRFVDADTVMQVQQLVQAHGAGLADITGPHAEQIRQTFAALQKYHAAQLAAGNVAVDQIRVAYLLGNPALNWQLTAISVASVFFGANTYIGNGPNFMVKAIADQQRAPTPGFLGCIFKYTLPFMLPMLLVVWWIFFRDH